ncbi:hypothetical protein HI030_07735 [Staphylococcus haemolyticus]|nr:hypothetical protein HI030_07735 [Staphylococcus haemolyticus]
MLIKYINGVKPAPSKKLSTKTSKKPTPSPQSVAICRPNHNNVMVTMKFVTVGLEYTIVKDIYKTAGGLCYNQIEIAVHICGKIKRTPSLWGS